MVKILIIIVLILMVSSFVAGVLVERRNANKAEKIIQEAKKIYKKVKKKAE